ncbi:hypothetical protein CEXT_15251 [Caerostris extrusa]|uniref:Uncharacterized protein n=1 Tax=Caerostris extrusa TaxID=172846 RepID=A0AAV4NYN3_CAEEX|nr:hypothetical protein CEXT_15251 [Caerostris extrusa]
MPAMNPYSCRPVRLARNEGTSCQNILFLAFSNGTIPSPNFINRRRRNRPMRGDYGPPFYANLPNQLQLRTFL